MNFNLRELLGVVGMTKPNFDAGRRAGLYGFLRTPIEGLENVELENSRRRYTAGHCLALACILRAADAGMSLRDAEMLVRNTVGLLYEALESGAIGQRDHFYLAVIRYPEGREHHAGTLAEISSYIVRASLKSDEPDAHPNESVFAVQMVDATSIYRALQSNLSLAETAG